jgi:hypothetical protein
MAFSGTTFSEIETGRLEVAEIIARQQRRLAQWRTIAGTIVSEMQAAGTEYGPIVAAMDALLATAPTDPTLIAKQGEIAKHLADFNALVAEAQAADLLVTS